jgi:putative peptidoglycan lipid II flippase
MNSRLARQTLVAASLVTIGTNVAGRLLGYAREAMIAGYFGTSATLDLFVLAFTLPELITFVAFAAIPTALIPSLKKFSSDRATDESVILSTSLILFTLLFAVVALLLYLFRGPILYAFAPELSPEARLTGERLLAIVCPFVFFRGLEAFFRSWLFEKKQFIVPAVSAMIVNVILLVTLVVMYDRFKVDALAWGWTIASALLAAFNGYFVLRAVRPSLLRGWRPQFVRPLLTFTLAVSVVEGIALLYPVVDRYLAAAFLGEGQIAALRYATFLIHIPTGMFIVAYTQSSFPWIADLSVASERDNLQRLYTRSIRLILFTMGFVAAATLIFPTEFVRLAFERGAFDAHSLELTSGPVFYFALGIVFYSVYLFQIKFYYARMTLRRLGVILTGMLLLKVLLSLVLVEPMQQNGLALATAITWLVGAVVMTADLGKTLRVSLSDLLSSDGYKMALGIAVLLVFLWSAARLWTESPGETLFPLLGRMSAIVAVGGVVYCGVAYLLRLDELSQLRRSLFGRGKSQDSATPE